MDNFREQEFTGRSSEDSHHSGEGSSLIEALDRDRGSRPGISIEHTQEHHIKQLKRKTLHASTFTTSISATQVPIVGPALFWAMLHLPDESDIGSVYVENNSGCNINVFEGPGGIGRLIGYATTKTYRVISMADNISNVSMMIDLSHPLADGLVIVHLFSHKWSPKMGTIV